MRISSKVFKWSLGALACLSSCLTWAQETPSESQALLKLSPNSVGSEQLAIEDSPSHWFSSQFRIFPYLKADPRQSRLSMDYRWDDKAFRDTATGGANIGGDAPIWYTRDLGYFDEFEVGLQAGVFGLFDMKSSNFEFMNSDWYACIPLFARIGDTSWRFRLYHISSHLGDKWMIDNDVFHRLNPSYEIIDLTAYRPVWEDRLYAYGTLAFILASDKSWPMRSAYFTLGAEYYLKDWAFKTAALQAEPYAAIHSQWWQMYNFSPNINTAVGISWRDREAPAHELLTSIEYYTGHSLEGQFGNRRTHYIYFQLAFVPKLAN